MGAADWRPLVPPSVISTAEPLDLTAKVVKRGPTRPSRHRHSLKWVSEAQFRTAPFSFCHDLDPAMNAPVSMPHVMPTYGRLPVALSHGEGARVWDTDGRRYLEIGRAHV